MKLVIDIDDELYKAICDIDDTQVLSYFAIKHGTPYETRPQGEWEFDGWGTYCSECGYRPKIGGGNFCPNCGADMRPKEGDSDG